MLIVPRLQEKAEEKSIPRKNAEEDAESQLTADRCPLTTEKV